MRAAGQRIAAARIEDVDVQSGEISAPFGRGGHSKQDAAADVPPGSLVISKHKELIPFDRPAERAAKLIPLRDGDEPAVGAEDRTRLGKRIARLNMIVAQILEAAAVERVSAGLGLCTNHARRSGAELRVVIGRGDLGFGHGLEGGINNDPTKHGVVVIGSIQKMGSARETLPVHQHPVGPLRILRRGRSQTGGLRNDAGGEQLKRGESSSKNGKAGDGLCTPGGCNIASFRLQQRSLGTYLHSLRDVAHHQPGFETSLGIDRHTDFVLQEALKSGGFDTDAICSGNQVTLCEVTGFIRGICIRDVTANIGNRYLGAGHGGA